MILSIFHLAVQNMMPTRNYNLAPRNIECSEVTTRNIILFRQALPVWRALVSWIDISLFFVIHNENREIPVSFSLSSPHWQDFDDGPCRHHLAVIFSSFGPFSQRALRCLANCFVLSN